MSFFKNLFSGSTEDFSFIEEFLDDFFKCCGFSLSCDVEILKEEGKIYIDIYGKDEELLIEQHGKLLQSLQIYLSSVLQNRLKAEEAFQITVDSQGYMEQFEQDLIDLAHRLKKEALKRKRSVIIKRPLNAFYRRKIHQDLTKDGRVETRSVGEGAFKRIIISPVRGKYDNNFRRA
ncbi:MAG: hypothetical protein OXK80_03095 [Bdellovibrionales bacterium]|nr:hypothetical protein [Bdellovibrionales bacterium]